MKSAKGKSVTAWVGLLVLVLALVAAAAAACSSDKGTATDDRLDLTEADSGKSFTVKAGATITVSIPGNPTTGYQWEADLGEESAALLTAEGEPFYEAESTDETLVGSGGTYTFTFTAAAAGQAELTLKYWRSFEPDVDPIDSFTATITIE
jgi:inhibitor of cysteine peptidase